eukprot:7710409-Alexandrium_andersonii.AAC.1
MSASAGDVLRDDPAALPDVALDDALMKTALAPPAADPGAMPGGPADRADVLARAVVGVAEAGLELAADISG